MFILKVFYHDVLRYITVGTPEQAATLRGQGFVVLVTADQSALTGGSAHG